MWQNPHLLLVQMSIQSLGAEEGNGGAGERERAGMELENELGPKPYQGARGQGSSCAERKEALRGSGRVDSTWGKSIGREELFASKARDKHQGTSDFLGQTAFCKAAGPVCVSSRLSCRVTEGVTKRTAWAKLQDSLEWPQHGAPGKSPPVTQRATDNTGSARGRVAAMRIH